MPTKIATTGCCIAGGGPAGMKAAITAAERGHKVTLYEKDDSLGGLLQFTDYTQWKWTYKDFKDFLINQVKKKGIDVKLNTAATPEMIKSKGYDTVLVATGAEPVVSRMVGADAGNVFNIMTAYSNKKALGKNVVFITLGCPTVYATCIYVHKLVLKDGYDAELVAGVTSICAVAAKLNTSLCERAEPLIVLPGSYKQSAAFLDGPGNKVLMKSASEIGRVVDELRERKLIKNSGMVERCGLPGEKIYRNLEEVDPKSSYFSVILVKEKEFDE